MTKHGGPGGGSGGFDFNPRMSEYQKAQDSLMPMG